MDIFTRPTTAIGRRCLTAFAVGVLGDAMLMLSIAAGQRGGETFVDNWWLSGPALVAAFGLVAAFVLGLVAITTRHERTAPVLLATALGALATFFVLGEIVMPH